jgi:transposase, IS5 family
VTGTQQTKLEPAAMVRIDSTVTAARMPAPSDSSLLWDAVRVMVRLLERASALAPAITWRNNGRLAKKRAHAIQHSRGKERKTKLYRDLTAATRATKAVLEAAVARLAEGRGPGAEDWRIEVHHYLPLIERVISQAERRVLRGEVVPASEKLVSLFEPHAGIIVKGGRDVQYGHKINLATGRSGLILDVVIETGNPADAERFLPMLERHIARHGKPPRQAACDGGYASQDNVTEAKALGVKHVGFHKKRGLGIEARVKSRWVYRKLRNFRAGIEANISCLKRAFGLARCTSRGLAHFRAYVWSSAVAYNLVLYARLLSAAPT